jgi:glycosyltransferase involved in cell wall biosynthesis
MSTLKRVINIVDNLDPVNAGIWKAAVSTAGYLAGRGVYTELWAPYVNDAGDVPASVELVLLRQTDRNALNQILKTRKLNRETDVIVTHGSWRFPTKWGRHLRKLGFEWVYTPQGMLEPWALSQKSLKKSLYLALVEKPSVNASSMIRAVSTPEMRNLEAIFPATRLVHIPNGVREKDIILGRRRNGQFLFMSRLHEKKGIEQLVKGWQKSPASQRGDCKLIIAGPDQGELAKIEPLMKESSNIEYVGAVYGAQKEKLLSESEFFVLPSHSEGFPTALLEAMNYGLVPLISRGCNLPEAFESGIAFSAEPDEDILSGSIETALALDERERSDLSAKARNFVHNRYTLASVAAKQFELFNELVNAAAD